MRKQGFYYILLIGWLVCLLSSCSKGEEIAVTVDRVLLVYLGADNNLSGESYAKLDAMTQGYRASANTRILVYQDASDGVPCLLEVGGQTIETYPAENSADPSVFSRVIGTAKSLYPQARFNLLVFSHASGWLPGNTLVAPRSVLVDGSDQMELSDFADAIPDQAFEYIIFETCFMAGIEVAYELRHKADYILASSAEIVSPGFTNVYRSHINELVSGNPKRFMNSAFEYFERQSGYMQSATFSMIRTDGLDALADWVRNNCDFTRVVNISEVQHFDRNGYHLFFDLGDYYSRLLENDIQKLQLEVLIDHAIVDKLSTRYFMPNYNGFAINHHSGLTTYIRQNQYPQMNQAYTELDWYKAIN